MVNNPYVLSELAASATNQIRDDLDFPHSGIYKALHQMIRGNYAVKDGTTDLSITQDVDSGRTRFTVTNGAFFRNGAYTSYTSGNVTLATNQVSRTTGNAYLLLVINSGGTLSLRGDNTTTDKVPEYTDGDILLALIQLIAGVSDNDVSRPMQFLAVTQKEAQSLSVGYSASNKYNEAMSITSDSDGDVTFENKVQDKDVFFKVNDGGTTKTLMKFDASSAAVVFENDTSSTLVNFKSTDSGAGSAPDLVLQRDSSTPAVNDQLGILSFQGNDDTTPTANNIEYARVVGIISDPSAGSEDGEVQISVVSGGAQFRQRLGIGSTEVVVNENGDSCDFRVESSIAAHAFTVEGGGAETVVNDSGVNTDFRVESSIGDRAFKVFGDGSEVVINDNATTTDFRVKGDTDGALFFTDGTNDRVGISTQTPLSTFHVDGSVSLDTRYETGAGPFTLGESDHVAFIQNASTVTVNLPALATAGDGRVYHIVALMGDVDIDPNGSENIDNSSTAKTISAGQWAKIISRNTNSTWITMGFGTQS